MSTTGPTARRARTAGATALLLVLASTALLLPSCAGDGHFCLLGYSSKPNYDTRYRTIRIPIFKNRTYWTVTPVPGMEMDLTAALVREVEAKTPYKVVQDNADTELKGTIVGFQKTILNFTQFNTIREAQTIMVVELIWRDLRTGEVLSKTARRLGDPLTPEPRQPVLATADSLLPPGSKPVVGAAPVGTTSGITGEADEAVIDPVTKVKAKPVVVRSVAEFRPELGESITTAIQRNIDRLAVQIVSAMETGW